MKKKPPKPAARGINQPVIDLIDDLQTHLNRPVRGHGYVHRIRVSIKRLRAWIRLVRDEEDAKGLRSMDHDLRDIMKKLSTRRDRQALLETVRWLGKKTGKDAPLASLDELRSHLRTDKTGSGPDWAGIKTALASVLDVLKQHAQKFDSMHVVRDGLQRTYKRAAKLGDKAFSGKIDPVDVHEFRKWAKYLFYQIEYIQNKYPELYRETQDCLEDLGDRLGRYHDLVLVRERLAGLTANKGMADTAKQTDLIIEVRMHKLLRRSNRLYRRIFSASPSKFVMDLP